MSLMTVETASADHDVHADETIAKCMNPADPKSFFLYAGAGSGKTRSLVEALKIFAVNYGDRLRREGRKVAVITYTNAACDEIIERVRKQSEEDVNLFHISTIHSFCWSLICNFHGDIQTKLRDKIPPEINDIEEKEAKGKPGTKASMDRQRKLLSLQKKLEWLEEPRQFTYNPNGDNFGKASLSHAEVLELTAAFIKQMPVMQEITVQKFPFLLIDESQDTNKGLIDAFFSLEELKRGQFAIGLLGDQMQRIYLDGMPKLDEVIPEHWEKPKKSLNRRCPKRVIQLSNTLRQLGDKQIQKAREDAVDGVVRLFIARSSTTDKTQLEAKVKQSMAAYSNDPEWQNDETIKSLTLEHHMAANRMGFLEVFSVLDKHPRLSTGVRDGSLPALRFFKEVILPISNAQREDKAYELMALCRKHSPLLRQDNLSNFVNNGEMNKDDPLKEIRCAINEIANTANRKDATFEDVLKVASEKNILQIPESLAPFIIDVPANADDVSDDDGAEEENTSDLSSVFRAFLELSYSQIVPYSSYVESTAEFDTHQGVKGREFDRVCVILDDSASRGTLFSFEKLFGVREKSPTDMKNEEEKRETSLDRTLKLLYVTCTRAEKSLAIVVYTENPNTLKDIVIKRNWFLEEEIEFV